eukprot:COSAG01_NODE_3486_length_6017_cov_8.866509_1_plen_29_part_10
MDWARRVRALEGELLRARSEAEAIHSAGG